MAAVKGRREGRDPPDCVIFRMSRKVSGEILLATIASVQPKRESGGWKKGRGERPKGGGRRGRGRGEGVRFQTPICRENEAAAAVSWDLL